MANITLTADEHLLAKARAYAHARKTTLNQLIRDHLAQLTGQLDPPRAAEEFAQLAHSRPGRSDADYIFDRPSLHARTRGKQRP